MVGKNSQTLKESYQNEEEFIAYTYIEDEHLKVLEKLADDLNAAKIWVKKVDRLGKSSAKVYDVVFSHKNGVQYIVKIDFIKDIRKECYALTKLSTTFNEIYNGHHNTLDKSMLKKGWICPEELINNYEALAYENKLGVNRQEIKQAENIGKGELERLILSEEFEPSPTYYKDIITKVYDHCFKCTYSETNVLPQEINLKNKYDDWEYFREKGSEERIQSIISSIPQKDHLFKLIDYLGEKEIMDPIFALNSLFNRNHNCILGPVHGDLHLRNIIIDKEDKPHLIDFKWADTNRHIFLDYVIMECSLRFYLLPSCYNLKFETQINEILLEEFGYSNIPYTDSEIINNYHIIMKNMIAEIRNQARTTVESLNLTYNFNEYLSALFLFLYGVIEVNEFHQYLSVHALGSIARKLRDFASRNNNKLW